MKFSWKLFFCTIVIICITFSIGGYILVSSLFESAIARELNLAREENKLLRISIEMIASNTDYSADAQNNMVSSIAQSVESSGQLGKTQVRITKNKEPLYESTGLTFQTTLINQVSEKLQGYMIIKEKDKYYIQIVNVLNIANETLYLESFNDITSVFTERSQQNDVYKKLIVLLILVNGILSYIISIWLTYPVTKLSKVTRKIAGGNLSIRADINSNDEIGTLAADFNSMADHLELKIGALKDSVRRQEDFIGSFAHEIKTPLTSIIGYADMLRSKEMPPERRFLAANYICEEGKRLEAISLKLLELIVLQKQDFELKKVNAAVLLDEIKGFINPVLEKEKISLEVSVEDGELLIEPDLIKTLCFNLIDNARKAIEGEGKITITGKKDSKGYKIYIKDSGKGIPREELSRITEAFYRVDKSRARTKGGVGLGLAICDEIVNLHNGKMEFDSTPGKGTTVCITLRDGER